MKPQKPDTQNPQHTHKGTTPNTPNKQGDQKFGQGKPSHGGNQENPRDKGSFKQR